MKDIGPETAEAFIEYVQVNEEMIGRLIGKLDIAMPTILPTDYPTNRLLSGKSFCVTGSFDNISRDEIHELIEKNGGEVRTSVTSKLDYLIV